jgi:uncharacterized metal-binding protein
MPCYRTHVRFNLCLALSLVCLGLIHYGQSPSNITSFALAFSYSTLFLHPDLDLARETKLFSLKGLLALPFWPYSLLFHHRGISHWPIIGTLTRLAYAATILWLIHWPIPHYSLWIFWGMASADVAHECLDFIQKSFKNHPI